MSSINAHVLNAMNQQESMESIEANVKYVLNASRVKMMEQKRKQSSQPKTLHNRVLKDQCFKQHNARPMFRRSEGTDMNYEVSTKRSYDRVKSDHIDRDIRVLLSRRNKDGDTPLTSAVRFGMHNVTVMLLEHGAKPNRTDKFGWTPLMYAARDNRIEIMFLLIIYGADRDTVSKDGESAQTIALKHGAIDFMQQMTRIVMNRNRIRV